jgi:hypothetical protein
MTPFGFSQCQPFDSFFQPQMLSFDPPAISRLRLNLVQHNPLFSMCKHNNKAADNAK